MNPELYGPLALLLATASLALLGVASTCRKPMPIEEAGDDYQGADHD